MLMFSGSFIAWVATAFHCAVFTATAARGLALLFIFNVTENYCNEDCHYN